MGPATVTEIGIHVARWAATVEGDEAPKLEFLDAMQRRRLSTLARATLACLWRVVDPGTHLPLLFASEHGEIVSTHRMLSAIVRQEAVSPTAFSHAVHNALAGQASILRHDPSPVRSIAAGLDSLPCAVLEAWMLLAQGTPQVLLVAADEEVPEPWRGFVKTERPYALAALLTQGAPTVRLSQVAPGARGAPGPARALLAVLQGAPVAQVEGERGDWAWRQAA